MDKLLDKLIKTDLRRNKYLAVIVKFNKSLQKVLTLHRLSENIKKNVSQLFYETNITLISKPKISQKT